MGQLPPHLCQGNRQKTYQQNNSLVSFLSVALIRWGIAALLKTWHFLTLNRLLFNLCPKNVCLKAFLEKALDHIDIS